MNRNANSRIVKLKNIPILRHQNEKTYPQTAKSLCTTLAFLNSILMQSTRMEFRSIHLFFCLSIALIARITICLPERYTIIFDYLPSLSCRNTLPALFCLVAFPIELLFAFTTRIYSSFSTETISTIMNSSSSLVSPFVGAISFSLRN